MQTKKRNIFMVAFAIIALGDWAGRILDLAWLDYTFKPLILPSLMIFLWASVEKKVSSPLIRWVLIGQFFSWCGDVSLMFGGTGLPFLLGLGSFLLAHIAYIVAFIKPLPPENKRKTMLIFTNYTAFVPLVLYLVVFYSFMQPFLGELEIPVLLYAVALMCMSAAALNRYRFTSGLSFRQIFMGSMFFMISDSLLAYSLFVKNFEMSGLFVMITYISAQFLICDGVINHHKNNA